MISFVPLEIGEFEEFIRKQRETGALLKLGPVREKEVVKIDDRFGQTWSALTTLIDVMEREDTAGRESFIVREYWRPNRLVSFKTFATPLLYMGRKERKIASKIDIAEDHKLSQRILSRVELIKIMRPLTAEERRIVDRATTMEIGSPSDILASHEKDSVQRSSMRTLRPIKWLNDEVINFFLKNCLARRDEMLCARETGRRRSHFFGSFFVQTMFDEKNNDPRLRGRYNYKNVRRWSKKVPGKDIFKLKYIFCPINLDNSHWTLAVIFMEDKRIQYYDSMGGTDTAKLEGLLEYVKDEYRVKNGKDMDAAEWELVSCTSDTPQQRNRELHLSVMYAMWLVNLLIFPIHLITGLLCIIGGDLFLSL